jgi:saccharopine dehydrogenase-like NADP-dependent oxidoreductase
VKKTITILGGAGMMSQGIIKDLLSDRAVIDIGEIRVCDTARGRMEAMQRQFGDARLTLHDLNVTDPAALSAVLAGADICINGVPTMAGHQMAIFEAALKARVDYVDLGGLGTFTVKQMAWHQRFVDAGVVAVLGVGSDPGMSNVICRAVADKLDEIDSINLYWAAELSGPESPVLRPPYSVSTVLAEYAHPCIQFLNGSHVECAPQTGKEVVDLPAPWGPLEFMYSAHSEQWTVPLAAGIRDKGIREFTWKLHLPQRENEAWIGLVKAGFGDFDRPVRIGGQDVRPLDVLNAVIARNMAENADKIPDQDSNEIHFAIGRGRIGGKPATVRCEVILRPDPLYDGYIDAGTSMNASIAAQLIVRDPRKPGVYACEGYFDVDAYFAEAKKRKFSIALTVNA